MDKNTMTIPNDFQGKVIEKLWFDKAVVLVIYFDEEKWNVDEMETWGRMISEFTECPTMMLPKSFSRLEHLDNDQMLLLKNNVDKAMAKMNGNQNK